MATPTKTRQTISTGGFDVTAIIGRVEFGNGDRDPVEAAFSIIGNHRASGEYHFPHEDGGEWIVDVSIKRPDTQNSEPDW